MTYSNRDSGNFFRSPQHFLINIVYDANLPFASPSHKKIEHQLAGKVSRLIPWQKVTSTPPYSDIYIIIPDLALVDALSAVNQIRSRSDVVPILVLRFDNSLTSKQRFFEAGADDYLALSYDVEELLLRISALVRRFRRPPEENAYSVSLADLHLNFGQLRYKIGECPEQRLTMRQAEVLQFLCEHSGLIVQRRDLLIHAWGKDDFFLGRSMDVIMTQIRRILSKSKYLTLETVHGIGFILHHKQNNY